MALHRVRDHLIHLCRFARARTVLPVDEKSQIQALDRTQPGLQIKHGRCGTTCMGIFPSRPKSRRACFGISVLGVWDDRRGARQLGAEHRATYLYSVDPRDLDHEAVIRIGGRAPERWAHSTRRPESHSWVRVSTTSDRHRMLRHLRAEAPKSIVYLAASSRTHLDSNQRLAGRHETPQFDEQLVRHGD